MTENKNWILDEMSLKVYRWKMKGIELGTFVLTQKEYTQYLKEIEMCANKQDLSNKSFQGIAVNVCD